MPKNYPVPNMSEIEFSTLAELFIFMDRDSQVCKMFPTFKFVSIQVMLPKHL